MSMNTKTRRKLSITSLMHYTKLFYRAALFLLALALFIAIRADFHANEIEQVLDRVGWLFVLIWVVYAVEMTFRFFPSRVESMGCQKQFRRNYRPTGVEKPQIQSPFRTLSVAGAWLLLNGGIAALYFTHIIGEAVLVLISLAYGVCDMVCILFFCPFQTWFMKNRCCTVCRIYNWDFAMMFTPFLLIPSWYTWSLLGMALLLLLRWEIALHRHPERFSPCTNASLHCQNCTEKLCHHKKQLRGFILKNRARFRWNR